MQNIYFQIGTITIWNRLFEEYSDLERIKRHKPRRKTPAGLVFLEKAAF